MKKNGATFTFRMAGDCQKKDTPKFIFVPAAPRGSRLSSLPFPSTPPSLVYLVSSPASKMEFKWPPTPSLNWVGAKPAGADPGIRAGKYIS